jgi:hypothetical protein
MSGKPSACQMAIGDTMMCKTNLTRWCSIGFLCVFCFVSDASAQLLNGSFETPVVNNGDGSSGYDRYAAGANIGGWTVTGGGVDIFNNSIAAPRPNAQNGSQYIDLSASAQGGITQSLSLLAGFTYTADFFYSASYRDSGSQPPKDFTVGLGSSSLNLSANTSGWLSGSLTFTPGVSGNYSLSFTGTDTGYAGAFIDNVRISAVPEPYEYGLVAVAGLLVLGAWDRRRQLAIG